MEMKRRTSWVTNLTFFLSSVCVCTVPSHCLLSNPHVRVKYKYPIDWSLVLSQNPVFPDFSYVNQSEMNKHQDVEDHERLR